MESSRYYKPRPASSYLVHSLPFLTCRKTSAPSVPFQVSTLPCAANILHVSIERFKSDESSQDSLQLLLATTADRLLHSLALDDGFPLVDSISCQDSPILAVLPLGKECTRTITCGMSGQTVLYDHQQDRVLDERRDHKKYVVKAASYEEDQVICMYFAHLFCVCPSSLQSKIIPCSQASLDILGFSD